MSSKGIGAKTGGKGSWRRKVKKAPSTNQEADKLWLAAQRQGCRDIGEIDSAVVIIKDQTECLSFTKPELCLDMRSNTYVLRGKPTKKRIADCLQDILSGIDFKGLKEGGAAEKEEELGDVKDVDFSKAEEKKE